MTQRDPYIHGHDRSVVSQHSLRTAEEAAAFLLPHLTPGMRLLDFGCGPGSITIGLAKAVAPGEVIGIDASEEIIAEAKSLAQGQDNLRFEVGSIYATGYPDESFDVAYAHQVLQHLADVPTAISEALRLLAPGGILAVRDVDYSSSVFYPREPAIERFLNLYHQVALKAGGDDRAGSRLKSWLLDAGLTDIEISSTVWTFADEPSIKRWGESWAERVTGSNLARQAIEHGLASQDELAEIAAGWRRWRRSPRAFFAMTHVAALARKAGQAS